MKNSNTSTLYNFCGSKMNFQKNHRGKMESKEKKETSCWECKYNDLKNDSFLGKCLWFEEHGREIKEIPPEIVDKGCKHFLEK
jgi:hypothetical protein